MDAATVVAAEAAASKIRPLRDRVLVYPVPYAHEFLYVAGIQTNRGMVMAIGPGRRMRRRIPWRLPTGVGAEGKHVNQGSTFYVEDGPETGKVRPMRVKIGDVVEYSFRDQFPVTMDGLEFFMVKEQGIFGTTTLESTHAILEASSSAID